MSYNNQLPVVSQNFTNIAAVQSVAVLKQIWLIEIIGGMLLMCQNTTIRVYGEWIKKYCALCSKTYDTLHSCHNFLVGLRQAARGIRICEKSLFHNWGVSQKRTRVTWPCSWLCPINYYKRTIDTAMSAVNTAENYIYVSCIYICDRKMFNFILNEYI